MSVSEASSSREASETAQHANPEDKQIGSITCYPAFVMGWSLTAVTSLMSWSPNVFGGRYWILNAPELAATR